MVLRGLFSALLLVTSLLAFIFGTYIALNTESPPIMRRLHHAALVEEASAFVNHHAAHHGRMPTTKEFESWAIRRWGEDFYFSYSSPSDASQTNYTFEFLEGGCRVKWRPDLPGMVEVSAADYFLAGSQLSDLLLFFGIGLATLLVAVVLVL